MKKIILLTLILFNFCHCEKSRLNFSCKELHSLHGEAKHLVNIRRLYDNLLVRNHVITSNNEIGYEFFKSEFSRSMSYNVSEEFYKATIFTYVK